MASIHRSKANNGLARGCQNDAFYTQRRAVRRAENHQDKLNDEVSSDMSLLKGDDV